MSGMENNKHNDERDYGVPDVNGPEPSNAWIWIILFLLSLIILFFVFGGDRLFGVN